MNKRAAVIFTILLLAVTGFSAPEKPTEEDNRILSLVLKAFKPDGGYTLVDPRTVSPADSKDPKGMMGKMYISEQLQTNGVFVAGLVERLFERNAKPVRLTLKSSPQDGYVIDSNAWYEKYFKKHGGGWEKLYKENPKAHSITTVSLPVYDQKTGLVLVYIATSSNWLAGTGWVVLYKYENGKLKELNRVMMWVA